MNVRLVLERKRKRTWTTQLRGPEATVGRALGSTIRIPSSEVSRVHCRLRVENGVVSVEDLESVNGTFLNGVRIRDTQIVRPGDGLGERSRSGRLESGLDSHSRNAVAVRRTPPEPDITLIR